MRAVGWLVLALGLAACGGARDTGGAGRSPAALVVRPAALRTQRVSADGPPIAWAEVAADPDARARGLMERKSLPPDGGMLFVYPEAAPRRFWMKNTRIPLATAFLDDDGRVLNIAAMAPDTGVPDHAQPRWGSDGPARYVLEMEAGWFEAHGIGVGARVELAPVLAGVRAR